MSDEFVSTKKNLDELHKADSFELSEEFSQREETESPIKENTSPPPFTDGSILGKYEQLKKDFEELDANYKRLWADQQNMLKRFQKDKEDLRKYGAQSTIEAILPAIDNFDFAKKSISMGTAFEEILKSFDMLKMQFQMALQALGISEIKTDTLFNPNLHEAVTTVPSEEHPEGTILEVIKTGYELQGKVIRPALVVVVANTSEA